MKTERQPMRYYDGSILLLTAFNHLETDEDHIHVFVSAPPRFSPAKIANLLKGYTSRFLRELFPTLKKKCGNDQLWTHAYYVGTAGQVTTDVIRRYIMECQGK